MRNRHENRLEVRLKANMIDQASAKTGKVQIVILGGGFGGVEAARYLDRNVAKRSDIEVTLVSRDNFSLFTPMLHEVAAGDLEPGDISNPLRKLLRHVNVLRGEATAIDLASRRVTISYGVGVLTRELPFDHLLLALGSETNYAGVPGVAEYSPGGEGPLQELADPGPVLSRRSRPGVCTR